MQDVVQDAYIYYYTPHNEVKGGGILESPFRSVRL